MSEEMKLSTSSGPFRQDARSVLRDNIRRAETDLNTLRTLERVIPWDELDDEDENKLWHYFCGRGR